MAIVNQKLIAQYARLHRETGYQKPSERRPRLAPLVELAVLDCGAKTVLDYGCGGGALRAELAKLPGVAVGGYDPAIPELARLPMTAADLVVCADVMEHIPEVDVDDVLAHIRAISPKALFNIALVPPMRAGAARFLPDGSPLHCTLRPPEWWREKIRARFGDAGCFVGGRKGWSVFLTTFAPRAPALAEYVALRVLFNYRLSFGDKLRRKPPPWAQKIRRLLRGDS